MMTWNDLNNIMMQRAIEDSNFMDENVTIYDRSMGEYYPADTIEFTEHDDVLDAGTIFITVVT